MARKPSWPPRVQFHRASGQARVRVHGKDVYLGRYGSPEAEAAYAQLVLDLGAGREAQPRAPRKPALRCVEAVERYVTHAELHYRDPDGEPTSQMEYVRRALQFLLDRFADLPAADFRAKSLKAVREDMVSRGWARSNVNQHVKCIRRAWRWLASEELVPPETYQSLASVASLQAGRTAARETEPVKPAEAAAVEATLPFLTPHLADAVRLQLLTACRPGEAMRLDPADLEIRPDVWLWRPRKHKTRHRGRERVILVGPRAQAIIMALIERRCPLCRRWGRARAIGWTGTLCGECAAQQDARGIRGPWEDCSPAGGYTLFSPLESERERRQLRRAASKTPRLTPLSSRQRGVGASYGVKEYAKAVGRACKKAGVEGWSPNQLRHAAATSIVEEFGYEIGRIILGHSSVSTTRVYAEDSIRKASEAVKRAG